jgi:alkyl hydroperoxide reductase subunit AhpC
MCNLIGGSAPRFDAAAFVAGDPKPQRITLDSYQGRWLVLIFYPRDFTSVCPTELHAFAELGTEFADEEASLLAASTDSYWSHRAWFDSHPALAAVKYPMIADTTQRVASDYGVLADDGSALRATFIIDPHSVVRHATISDQNVGRSPQETLRVVQALHTGAFCPVGWRKGQPTLRTA